MSLYYIYILFHIISLVQWENGMCIESFISMHSEHRVHLFKMQSSFVLLKHVLAERKWISAKVCIFLAA